MLSQLNPSAVKSENGHNFPLFAPQHHSPARYSVYANRRYCSQINQQFNHQFSSQHVEYSGRRIKTGRTLSRVTPENKMLAGFTSIFQLSSLSAHNF